MSEVLDENATKRIDPEFFMKAAVDAFRRLKDEPRLGEFVKAGYRVVYETTKIVDREEGQANQLPYFLQSADITTPFINADSMSCVPAADWLRYPKGRIKPGELLIEVKGKAEKVAVVPDDFPPRTLVTGTCYKLSTHEEWQRSLLVAHLIGRYGAILKDRLKTNLLVAYIAKADLYRIPVPNLGAALTERVHTFVEASLSTRNEILLAQESASSVLLAAIGLSGWTPPEPLSFTARASAALAAGRLDARFYAPRIQALLDLLSVDGRIIRDVARPRREKFHPADCLNFNYIEIGGIDRTGAAVSTNVASSDAPSRATWHVRPDDIITSTVRPIRRLSAQIAPEQDGDVCSSGFVVVQPHAVAPEVLLTYLRLPVICELLDLYASASMYPAITDADIFNLPLPTIPDYIAEQITRNVQDAKTAKARATNMLDAAKRAVEIAIEDGEPAAMSFLDQAEEGI
jgi:hypothetical protein